MSKGSMEFINSQVNLTTANPAVQPRTQNAWKSRSSLEKALIMFSILCLGTVIALAVAYGLLRSKTDLTDKNICPDSECSLRNPPETAICLKKGCINAANNLLESIDFNVQPCDDFYQYACGNWKKQNIIPEDKDSYDQFNILVEDLDVTLRNIFQDTNEYSKSKAHKMIIDRYSACMNESAINTLKGQPLIDILDQVMGGWPLLIDNWNSSKFDWIYILAKSRLYGETYFIGFSIDADLKNNSNNIIALDQTDFGLERNYLLKENYEKQRNAYETYMNDVATLLNNGTLQDQQRKDISNILRFERELVNITKPPEERRNQTRMYNKMSLSEVQTRYKAIDFKRYLSLVLPTNIKLQDDEPIIVNEIEYYEELEALINKTDTRIIANYIGWRFAQSYIWHLSKEFRLVQQKYLTILKGTVIEEARWKKCVHIVKRSLGLAVGMLYVNQSFHLESKEAVELLIKDLKVSFAKILRESDWMDDQTKAFGLKKLEKIDERIGYQKEYVNYVEIDKEYDGLNVSADDHFLNELNGDKYWTHYELKELRTGYNKTRWGTTPAVVNAYYESSRNSICFPAGILQPPFFNAERPRSMNYGAIGMVIGHEITHGFDDEGRQFDATGNLHQWWQNEAEKKFNEKTKCIINQYASYSFPELNLSINGILTQGENIADNGGLRQAYMAYKKAEEKNGFEPLLPGLNFTHDQLFFLGFANMWCGNEREETLEGHILEDTHSPDRFRVIGSLANSLEFRDAFNCHKGSKMYQEEICRVW